MDSFRNDGMRFDVSDTGPVDGRAVILLHGFPNDRTAWDAVAAELAAAGCRVLAPDQRGYSPGARPRRRRDYRLSRLAGDVLALADQAGADRFDLVGHDWGAAVAYELAGRQPHRVRSVTALSVPHPGAWLRSLVQSRQAVRSAYMAFFQLPFLPERLLGGRSAQRLRAMLVRTGLDPRHADRYAIRAARPGGLTGPLNWYRAIPFNAGPARPTPVSTLLVWSDGDRFVTRTAAGLCGRWVRGPYRFEVLPGLSHWLPDEAPARVSALILEHLAAVPVAAA
jgi:pimeloyl-ACP methyl ester carboxylesterase